MNFFKKLYAWVRFWYRRLRYGPFNSFTPPMCVAPYPVIHFKIRPQDFEVKLLVEGIEYNTRKVTP